MRTLDLLLEEKNMTLDELSERTKLPLSRLEAIADGRWTPSPSDRKRIADAFEVEVEQIVWGHNLDPRNVRYRRFGLKEDF
ncbi:MAG: hypothetical protein CMJ78_14510 [Planctomycetaceae bacterium]|nr:hypothetical protein [Planctomycetaceae bacterium]